MVRVAAAGEAGDLAVDVRAARQRALQLLQDQHRAALAHHEPVAVAVERARGVLRVVVAGGGGLDRVEAGHRDRGDRRLRRAGDDDVGLAVLDQVVGVADRVDPRGAAGRDDHRRAVRAELQRDLGREAARDQRRVEEGAGVVGVDEPLLAAVADGDVVVLQVDRAADRGAERDGHAVAVDRLEVEAAVRDRLDARRGRELDVAVHARDLLAGQPGGERVEVGLGGDLRAEARTGRRR